MPTLMVNIDHIATIREARGTPYPDPVHAVAIVEMAGASGIIVHLREDRRHIKDRDVRILREVIKTKLNLEVAATAEMVKIAGEIKPDMVTLVPEKREELTTEGGLDVVTHTGKLKKSIERLHEKGIGVSLFVDHEKKQNIASHKLLADMIVIRTGAYSDAKTEKTKDEELKKIIIAAKTGKELGLKVNAGHGLHYFNVREIASIPEIDEFSIGHSIIARALFVGLDKAIRDMIALIEPGERK